MLPTPDTSHVSFDTIYEPAEDSFLLLDTLSSPAEVEWLHQRFTHRPPVVVEIGTGSGVVISFLTAHAEHIFGKPILSLGVDVNMGACIATQRTCLKAIKDEDSNSFYASSVCSDLCSTILPRSIDVLVFNPPYVPTEELPSLPGVPQNYRDKFESDSHLLSLSYAGGADGMETTNRLLAQLSTVLSKIGVAYILLCAQNRPEEVKRAVQTLADGPWLVETVGRSGKKAGWEKLQIIRIWRLTQT